MPIGHDNVQFGDVISGGAIVGSVRTAGIIRDHPSQGSARTRGNVRAKAEVVRAQELVQLIEDDPWADADSPPFEVEFRDLPVVARKVYHQSFANRAPDQPGSRTAGND